MKTLTKAVLILAMVAACILPSHAQTALTQTTLASAVNGPPGYNGNSSTTTDNCWTLASVTGISAPTLPGTPVSVIYAGREAFGVLTVNTTAKVACGFRGYLGTQASPHPSGDMVLIQAVYSTGNGANPIPSGFFQQDPTYGGACSSTGIAETPWVNVLTGSQWLCSSITGTWAPGFGNILNPGLDVPTAAVASASTILPTGPLFHLTGTTSVTTVTQPIGCDATAVGACQFTVICDGVCTWAASGNIAVAAGTVVAGTMITFTWDAKNSKWVPNVVT